MLTHQRAFGRPRGYALDRNAKARVIAYARGYNSRHRKKGQHWGPLTRSTMQVLEALLWGFLNSRDGACFPSYESIAAKANCHRDTVNEAIKALEAANILTWINCFTKKRVLDPIFGLMWKVFRTSNFYLFRDPWPEAHQRHKTEKSAGTLNQAIPSESERPRVIVLDPQNPLHKALIRLGRTTGNIPSP